MSKMTMTLKRNAWMLGAAFGAVMALAHLTADAHVASGAQSDWCSPHDASKSNGGSDFSGCKRYSTYQFSRDFTCDGGTPCANALCGGNYTCGFSSSWGSSTHGKKGGHAFALAWSECGVKNCL